MNIGGITVHPSVTLDRVMQTAEDDEAELNNTGICILCGCDQEGVEPDAAKYKCENPTCGAELVFGAEQLALMMM